VEIALEPKAFGTLMQLLARPGELVTRDQLLDAVWGHRYVTPATLNRVVTLLRRAFADDAANPRFIDTVHGAGYRYIGPFEQQERALELRARFEPPSGARLPSKLDALIGRGEELTRLQTLMQQHRAITIVGAGGIGKTQCALEFARQSAGSFPDGVWFLDLVPFDSVVEWLQSLASALGVRSEADSALQSRIAGAFQNRRALLLLDNCDRIATAVGEVVIGLLRECEDLKVLATSQLSLNFLGEHLLNIPPLALPREHRGIESDLLDEIAAAPAVNLFVTRAQAVQSNFALSSANCATVARICERLDGLPLALELAAARLSTLSVSEVLERLERRFQLLIGSVSGRADRHQTLAALLDWSVALLSAPERELLCALAVFVPSWTVDAAEEIAGSLGFEPSSVVDMLGALVSKSLVSVDPTQTPTRYRLLESVRAFSLQKLLDAGLEHRARDAHLAHYKQVAERGRREILSAMTPRPRGPRVEDEYGNIDAAIEWAVSPTAANRPAAIEIAAAMSLYVKSQGEYLRGAEWARRVLADGPPPVTQAGARLMLGLGVLHFYLRTSEATPALTTAIRIAQETGDRWTVTYACGYHACHCALLDRAAEAQAYSEQTAELADALDDNTLRGLAALARGFTCLARQELENAVVVLSEGARLGHDIHQQHFLYMYAGLASFGLGRLSNSAAIWSDALVRSIQVHNIRGAAGSIEGSAYIDVERGEYETAAWRLGAAQGVRERSSLPLFEFWRAHHARACEAARAALGEDEYERSFSQGARARVETAINQAHARLQHYAMTL
jgi:predicted ATPase/DNA-binding winged helix-turn-helix (wHTH) protein